MTSVNIQFREDADTIEFLKARGVVPSKLAKDAFEREVRRMRAQEHAKEIERLGVKLPAGLAERAVRDARDSR